MNLQNKRLKYISLGVGAICLILLGIKMLTASGIIGLAPATGGYSRTTSPFGFIIVLILPLLATSTLFLGLARSKK